MREDKNFLQRSLGCFLWVIIFVIILKVSLFLLSLLSLLNDPLFSH